MFELKVERITRPVAFEKILSRAGATLNSDGVGSGLYELVESLKRQRTPLSP